MADDREDSRSPKAPAPKRAKKARPQLRSGHDCIFVEEVPDHLPIECSVCLCILEEPQLLNCSCGAHFCKSCIEPVRSSLKPCPLCKSPFTTLVLDRRLQRTINGLKIYCPFKLDGCKWVGELKGVSEHMNTAPSGDCKHVGCPYVLLECTHCNKKFQRRSVVEHELRCQKRPVCCELCGEYTSTIEDVDKNHKPQCTSRPVPCPNKCDKLVPSKSIEKHKETECPLEMTNCVFSYAGCNEKVLRKDMEAHVAQSLSHHLTLQAIGHKEMVEKQESMQKEIDQLRERFDDKTSTLEEEIDRVKDDVDEIKSHRDSLHTHVNIVPVHLVLNEFVAKRKAKGMWYSRPFYSSCRGYRMCLVVYPNGHKSGENTHISVYIRLVSGDFDNQLDWPFQGSVYVSLMDQRDDDDHWVEKIEFNEEPIPGSSPEVKKGTKNTEWGNERFISQELLCQRFYDLESDSLHFEVTNVRNRVDCTIM